MLVAIVSQNSFVLIFIGYRTIIARYVAKWVSHRCAFVKLSAKGVLRHFGGVLTSLKKYCAIWGITALVSQYRATQGHELGSYILRDTPEPRQLKAPGPKPTIKQLKEARKGNGSPRKGNQWPRKGDRTARNRNRPPYGFNCRVSRRAPKKWPKYGTLARVTHIHVGRPHAP